MNFTTLLDELISIITIGVLVYLLYVVTEDLIMHEPVQLEEVKIENTKP
jgi:hypothetical protein